MIQMGSLDHMQTFSLIYEKVMKMWVHLHIYTHAETLFYNTNYIVHTSAVLYIKQQWHGFCFVLQFL